MDPQQVHIIGTVFRWGALLGVIYAAYRAHRYVTLGSYRPLPATVIRSEVARESTGGATGSAVVFVAKIEYEYELGGRMFKGGVIDGGGDIWTSSRNRADALCSKYRLGDVVTAFVDPEDFENAYLERSPRAIVVGAAGTALVYGIGVFLGGF